MAKKPDYTKLKALIRKVVQEELDKVLKSNDPRNVSTPADNFDLDPRFSTGHYTMDREPFPHFDERSSAKHQSKRRTDQKSSGRPTHEYGPYPGGGFGPPPPPPEMRSEHGGAPGWGAEYPPTYPPPHAGFGPPPTPESRQSRREDR